LPLLAGLTWIYTLLGVFGAWLMWRSRDSNARRWLLMAALLMFLRLGFFATLENPEPRYTVELFPFLILLAAAGLSADYPNFMKTLRSLRKKPTVVSD